MLNEVVVKCLRGIESELDSRARVAKLKSFISLTRGVGVTEAGRLGQNWVVLTSDRGAFASYVFLNRVRAFESPQGYQLIFAENCAIVELLKQIGGIK